MMDTEVNPGIEENSDTEKHINLPPAALKRYPTTNITSICRAKIKEKERATRGSTQFYLALSCGLRQVTSSDVSSLIK